MCPHRLDIIRGLVGKQNEPHLMAGSAIALITDRLCPWPTVFQRISTFVSYNRMQLRMEDDTRDTRTTFLLPATASERDWS